MARQIFLLFNFTLYKIYDRQNEKIFFDTEIFVYTNQKKNSGKQNFIQIKLFSEFIGTKKYENRKTYRFHH